MRENSRKPLEIELDPHSTFKDVKTKIKYEEDHDTFQQELFHQFYPLNDSMVVADVLEEGASVTAVIAKSESAEKLPVSRLSIETVKTIHLIIGGREKLDIIPLTSSDGRKLPSSCKFGLLMEKSGDDGLSTFTCNIYKNQGDIKMVIKDEKIFHCSGTLLTEVQVEKQKTFNETNLKKGPLIENMKETIIEIEDLLELENPSDGIALAKLQEKPQEQQQQSEKGRLINTQHVSAH